MLRARTGRRVTMEDEIPITRNLDADTIRSLIAVASGCKPEDVDIIVDGEHVRADARTTVDALQTANRKHAKRIRAADAEANADAIRRALEADSTDDMFDILSSSPAGKDAQ